MSSFRVSIATSFLGVLVMVALFASLPMGQSSGVLVVSSSFSFWGPLSRGSIMLLVGLSAWVFFFSSCSYEACEADAVMAFEALPFELP